MDMDDLSDERSHWMGAGLNRWTNEYGWITRYKRTSFTSSGPGARAGSIMYWMDLGSTLSFIQWNSTTTKNLRSRWFTSQSYFDSSGINPSEGSFGVDKILPRRDDECGGGLLTLPSCRLTISFVCSQHIHIACVSCIVLDNSNLTGRSAINKYPSMVFVRWLCKL